MGSQSEWVENQKCVQFVTWSLRGEQLWVGQNLSSLMTYLSIALGWGSWKALTTIWLSYPSLPSYSSCPEDCEHEEATAAACILQIFAQHTQPFSSFYTGGWHLLCTKAGRVFFFLSGIMFLRKGCKCPQVPSILEGRSWLGGKTMGSLLRDLNPFHVGPVQKVKRGSKGPTDWRNVCL